MKSFFCYIPVILILFTGCTKIKHSKTPPDQQTGPTIQVISGANQTGNAGTVLKDSIVIQVNEPVKAVDNLLIEIHLMTNAGNAVIQKYVPNNSKFNYSWLLNNDIGTQTLKFYVRDSTSAIIDSISVTANAVQGWRQASGVSDNLNVTTFAKLSTGRLILGLMGAYTPYYSDDNGLTWHSLSSFYFNYAPWAVKIAVGPTDDIFIGSELNGVFYSADGGKTWENRSNGIPDITPISGLNYNQAGKLIFTTNGGGIYISNDKGLNWSAIVGHDPNFQAHDDYMATQANGDIFFLQTTLYSSTLLRLSHTDLKLHPVTGLPVQNVTAYYIDENGNSYVGGSNSDGIELDRSVDGVNWSKVFTLSPDANDPSNTLYSISKQGDGCYYFYAKGGYYKTNDFTHFQAIPATIPVNSLQYIVAANNNLVINSYPVSVWYYQQ